MLGAQASQAILQIPPQPTSVTTGGRPISKRQAGLSLVHSRTLTPLTHSPKLVQVQFGLHSSTQSTGQLTGVSEPLQMPSPQLSSKRIKKVPETLCWSKGNCARLAVMV